MGMGTVCVVYVEVGSGGIEDEPALEVGWVQRAARRI
jgi:hypothetical protein